MELPAPVLPSVFLSYARADDGEPYDSATSFAARLHRDLTAAGFDVWFDQVSMPSRQLTFHQEIKDAIRKCSRLVYIAGPGATVSTYVRAEWDFALECDKTVIPILRKGDITNVPGQLCLLHCDDFRDDGQYARQLAKLVDNLKRPDAPLGHLFAVPNLPPHFLARQEVLHRLRDAVQIDLQTPVVATNPASRVGLQGMGGIGKSVLAAAVARDRDIRRSYPDGIVWISFGQIRPEDAAGVIAQLMRDVARHLGDPGAFENIAQGQGVLRELLLTKSILLVQDDVWSASDAQPFDVLGPRCRALITTRDAGVVRTLHGQLLSVELFTEAEALALLALAVDRTPEQLPPEAKDVVKECDGLALAVALCAGMAKARGGQWGSILQRLLNADLAKIEDRQAINPQHRSVYRAMQASVEMLKPEEQRRFAELSVFVTDQNVPEAAIATLWAHTGNFDALDTEDLLILLSDRSLIQLQQLKPKDGRPARQMSLHDLLYDYALRAADDRQDLNRTLLEAYRKKCPEGWSAGPDDGYFFRNISQLLATANGSWDEAVDLLCDLQFVAARCRVNEVFELLADYRLALDALPEAQERLKERRERRALAAKWTGELIRYARGWSDRREGAALARPLDEEEPKLPEMPVACRVWSDQEVRNESKRIVEQPTRFDWLTALAGFVSAECYPLQEFGQVDGFVVQHAWNSAPAGLVHGAASGLLARSVAPVLLRRWQPDAAHNPMPSLLSTLKGHHESINSVSMTPDGRLAVSSSWERTLRVWDLESGACVHVLAGHSAMVHGVSVTPDGRLAVSGSADATLRVWDLEHGTCLFSLEGHSDAVLSVSVTPDGRRAISASQDQSLRIWELDGLAGRCVRVLQPALSRTRPMDGMNFGVTSVSITPDGRRAISGGDQNTLCLWDLQTGDCLRTLEGHVDMVSGIAVTPDGRRAISGSLDQTVRVWDLSTGVNTHKLQDHGAGVWAVGLTPDGRRAVSSSLDGIIRVWDLDEGCCIRTLAVNGMGPVPVDITFDGQRGVTGNPGSNVGYWDFESTKDPPPREVRAFQACSISPNSRRALTASHQMPMQIWNLESEVCLRKLPNSEVNCVSIALDGRYAVSGLLDNTIQVWDIDSGLLLRTLGESSDDEYVARLSITPDGRVAVSSHLSGKVKVWDVDNGACLVVLEPDKYNSDIVVRLTSDGRYVLTSGLDSSVCISDVRNGSCLRTLGHDTDDDFVYSLNLTPDGRRAISGHSSGVTRIWDIEQGANIRTLAGHSGGVESVSLTSDSRYAVSGGNDGSVRLWDLANGECLAVYVAESSVLDLAIDSNENRMFVGTLGGCLLTLDVLGIRGNLGRFDPIDVLTTPTPPASAADRSDPSAGAC